MQASIDTFGKQNQSLEKENAILRQLVKEMTQSCSALEVRQKAQFQGSEILPKTVEKFEQLMAVML